MTQRLRIFISSPGDVQEERLRAHLVVQKLARDYARFFRIEAYLWEYEPMLASGHFQDALEPPSASDIVVLIVYSRLGTPLPERSAAREYRGLDGRAPVTGTEWEFEEALDAHRRLGTPDLLAYRKVGDPGASLTDAERRADQERQWNALESFWRRHFETGSLFLAGSARFETLEDFDHKLEADLVALIERRIAAGLTAEARGGEEPTWFKGRPFRGFASYDFDDAPIFFGRDLQTRTALTRLQAAADRGPAFLLVLGASGSGKSSLARAGILPALFAAKAVPGVAAWRRVIVRPGEGDPDPVLGLARALVTGDPARGIGLPELTAAGDMAQFAAHLAAASGDPSFPFRAALEKVIADERRERAILPHETARLVLLVDQMEELFTRRIDTARRALFVRILAALARSGLVWVVATMRNDLWHRAAEVAELVALVEAGARLDLPGPDAAEIIEIIRRPAAAAGLTFETDPESGVGLDATIARAASEEPGALPLLSVTLDALYQRDIAAGAGSTGPARQLRYATYRELGELKGAIARRADEVLAAVAATDPQAADALPALLRTLVTASASGDAITSRPAPLSQFGEGTPEARLVAAMLASDARLLVASRSGAGAEVRLAHEALIEHWPTARDQIARDRRDLETRTRLETLLRRWSDAAGGDRARALLSGLNLAEGADLVRRWHIGTESGLGAFVRTSARADAWRRRRMLIAASVLLCVFAGIAALAGWQWKRAENQAALALQAQATEKAARDAAEADRARATESAARADAALRETRLETARTLSAQVQLALGQKDIRQALGLAVKAATTEQPVLQPGDRAASEPALLQALAQAREVVHIRGASQNWWVPYGFLDDSTLVYADAHAGVVWVDLRHDPAILGRVALPGTPQATHLAVAGATGLVVVTSAKELMLIDTHAKRIVASLAFPDWIDAIDVDAAGKHVAVAMGTGVGVVDLDHPALPAFTAVPEPRNGVSVGQVRFAADGTVLASYGIKVLAFDPAGQHFSGQVGTLSGAGVGVDDATLDSVLAGGKVAFVRLFPDIGTGGRYFTLAPLDLRLLAPAGTAPVDLPREDQDSEYSGMAPIDQERAGTPGATAAVLSRSRDDRLQFDIRYASDRSGPLVGKDGRPLPPFESFAVAPADFADQKPDTCTLSPNVSFLVCQYAKTGTQGMVVWRLLGGNHRFERVAERYNASSAVMAGAGGLLLVSTDKGIASLADGAETKLADLPADWRLAAADDRYVAALSPAAKQAQVFRFDGARLAPALAPLPATGVVLLPGTGRALVTAPDHLALVEIDSGKPVWTAPIAALKQVTPIAGDHHVVAVAPTAAYVLDLDSGRILTSYPLALAASGPLAIDAQGRRLAYVDASGVAMLLDLASGTAMKLETGVPATQFAWSNDGARLLAGGGDGSVVAIEPGKGRVWQVPSPFGASFQASAWPGQPPQGTVLQFALSHDGRRFAIIRQDMPAIDIRDLADGRHLTDLTPPWSTLQVPAEVSFGPDDELIASWAVHAMVRDKPRFVTMHRLPRNFDEALAAANARLAALNAVWSPEGPSPGPAN